MTFLGHANQEVDSIRRTSIVISLPKDLYPLAKNVPILSGWLFGDDKNAKINNVTVQQKDFKVEKTYFKPERSTNLNLKSKKVFVNTDKRSGNYISGVFTRGKKDGSHRMILNLKNFNKFICYRHFKIESIQNVLNAIKKDTFVASIDLKDAFYSVPVAAHHQKYLKIFANEYLNFTCLPNGYGPAMRIFTKIMKAPFSVLRMQGYNSAVYVDDSYLQGDSYECCLKNVNDTIIMLRSLGFIIYPEKSVLLTQDLMYLGFIINSRDMTLKLTEEKKQKNYDFIPNLLKNQNPQFDL